MNYSIIKNVVRSLAAVSALAVSSVAIAAGPLAVCNSGEPFAWPNGGANVPFNPDQGGLGILDNATATIAVSDAFQAWGDVATATISYANAGQLPVDVDVTNFVPFLQPSAPDGLSAIVYDDSGEIFDLIFGPGSGVLGFAGPEWINSADCEILEGVSFLNGPAIGTLEGLLDLMVHEFGHYSNLAHTEVNGQLFIGVGDSSGPGDSNTFGFPPFPDPADIIETMYPFLFGGIDQRARTPHADDVASLSRIYPTADFAATTGSINGTIFLGSNKVTGVNVIARNVNDPFVDAVSGISSDQTDDFSQANPFTGIYRLDNLTPGAEYAVYIDEILAGGFSTPLTTPLPGVEEFWNGANESAGLSDVPTEFVPIAAAAGTPADGIDIIFNIPPPGLPLAISDDGDVQIPLPFAFCVAGEAYDTVYINGNGFLTFGAPATGLTFLENAPDFLGGAPRVAAFWDDLNPEDGGSVIYTQTDRTFSVSWDSVPEFFVGGANTATVTLRDNSSRCVGGRSDSDDDDDLENGFGSWGGNNHYGYFFGRDVRITHGELSSTDGLVGVSSGLAATSGFEEETDLSRRSRDGRRPLSLYFNAAVYEQFSDADVDLAGLEIEFIGVGKGFRDRFERNDSVERAARISLPFDSINTAWKYTSISPAADDIDFFQFRNELEAGTTLVAEVLTGQVDTVLGLYRCTTTTSSHGRWWHKPTQRCDAATIEPVAFDDDGGNGLLSRIVYEIPENGTYGLAVTFCCDYDFDGVDPGQGAPLDGGRYVLDAFVIDGILLELTDESFEEVALGFDFPFQGSTYNSVFVNSNGYLTFGSGEIFNFTPTVAGLEGGLPRIAPLWVDLDPGSDGVIIVSGDSSSLTVNYAGIPEFFFGGSNTFSTTLLADGSVSMSFMGVTAPEGLTGVAEGLGAPGTAVDLSTSGAWPAAGTTYELFDFLVSPFDLDGAVLVFD